jgi:hypothetical protein
MKRMVGVVADFLQVFRTRPHCSWQGPGASSWRDWGGIGNIETADPSGRREGRGLGVYAGAHGRRARRRY